MSRAPTVAIVALIAVSLLEAGQQDQLSFEEVRRVDSAPTIDGRTDDPAWQQASRLSGFTELFVRDPGPAKLRTDAFVSYDDRGLYLAGRCYEQHMDRVRATFTTADNPLIWRDDCVELYFDPSNAGEQFAKITIGAAGGVTDLWRAGRKHDLAWDARGLKAAVVRGRDAWVWEMALPWEALDVSCPEGRVWTFCLVRFSYTTGRLVAATWSPGGHSATPERHGLLCFGPMLDSWVAPVAARRGAQWSIGRPDFELHYRRRAAVIGTLRDRAEHSLAAAALELAPLEDAAAVRTLRQQLNAHRTRLSKVVSKSDTVRLQQDLERLSEQADQLHWESRIARLFAER